MLAATLVLIALHGGASVADSPSCTASVDKAQARILVERCLEVSPATHPPCNALNPCDLIIDEIRRGCAFLQDSRRPGFCSQYPNRS